MRLTLSAARTAAAAAVVAASLAVGSFALAAPAHADGTPSPWAPGGVNPDQNAKGGLTFYDSTGAVITGGSLTARPIAAYTQGRVIPRHGDVTDTAAVLFAYVPIQGQTPDTWSNDEQITPASTYPNSAAPGALATSDLPLDTGKGLDKSVAQFTSDLPNTATTAGYQNVYEIRQYVNAPGQSLSAEYNYADISIDSGAGTWSVVYSPSSSTAPTAPTNVTATAGNASIHVAWGLPTSDGGSPITGYHVQYKASSASAWNEGPTSTQTSTARSADITGLINGTSYVVRVAAINGTGTSPYASSSAVTPVADASSLTIAHAKVTITAGKSTTVSGTLRDTKTGKVIGGQSVTIKSRANSGTAWTSVKSVTTNASGVASLSVKPAHNTQYELVYSGNSAHSNATSGVEAVTVAQAVSIAANHLTVKHGTQVKIYGTVMPSASGQAVTLERKSGTKWVKAATATTKKQKLPNGQTTVGYVFTQTPGKAGSTTYRAYRPATSTNGAGTSKSITVKAT